VQLACLESSFLSISSPMKAVIFDMDGVLIDSEPLWKRAEAEVFGGLGVTLSEDLTGQTASMTTKAVTEFWFNLSPWQGPSLQAVEQAVIHRVEELIVSEGRAIDGVIEVVDFFKEKGLKIGLATNSPAYLIPAILNQVGVTKYFDITTSAEDEKQGKPHPAVYLTAAKKLQVVPADCLVIEDSVSGLKAARNAGMKTVWLNIHGLKTEHLQPDVEIGSFSELQIKLT